MVNPPPVPETDGKSPSIFAPCNVFKSYYSVCLLTFSTSLVMGLIFTDQTKIASQIHPAVAFITILVAVVWLTMIEGAQASIIGLAPVNRELHKDSHPKA